MYVYNNNIIIILIKHENSKETAVRQAEKLAEKWNIKTNGKRQTGSRIEEKGELAGVMGVSHGSRCSLCVIVYTDERARGRALRSPLSTTGTLTL